MQLVQDPRPIVTQHKPHTHLLYYLPYEHMTCRTSTYYPRIPRFKQCTLVLRCSFVAFIHRTFVQVYTYLYKVCAYSSVHLWNSEG